MDNEFKDLYDAYSHFISKLDEMEEQVYRNTTDSVLMDITKMSNVMNTGINICRELDKNHRITLNSNHWIEELNNVKAQLSHRKENIKGFELEPQVKKQIEDVFQTTIEKVQLLISELDNFQKEYRSRIKSNAEIIDALDRTETYQRELARIGASLTESLTNLKKKAIDVVNYSEALYHTKEKIINEAICDKELGRVEVIKNWPIPTAYQFLVYAGLGMITTGMTLTIFNSIRWSFIPIIGSVFVIIGIFNWYKHDRARLVAYSRQTNIDAEGILRDQGLAGYFYQWALLDFFTGRIDEYNNLKVEKLSKMSAGNRKYEVASYPLLILSTAISIAILNPPDEYLSFFILTYVAIQGLITFILRIRGEKILLILKNKTRYQYKKNLLEMLLNTANSMIEMGDNVEEWETKLKEYEEMVKEFEKENIDTNTV